MTLPSVTYTFTNGTSADAVQVNQNFTDIINGLTDGTKSLQIDALTAAGAAIFNGHVTLGNADTDDLTVNASLASSIPIKTNNSFNIGAATLGLAGVYLGSAGGLTTRIVGGAAGSSWTLTLPTAVPAINGYVMESTTGGVASWSRKRAVSSVTKAAADSPYTLAATDDVVFCNATAGAITVDLPAAASHTGRVVTFRKTDTSTNTVTIDGNGSETIGGSTTRLLHTVGETYDIVSDGSNWQVLRHDTDVEWTAYTPTLIGDSNGTTFTNQTTTGKWKRVGDTMHVQIHTSFSGAPGGGTGLLAWGLPSGVTIDTSKLVITSGSFIRGIGQFEDSGTGYYDVRTRYRNTTTVFASAKISGAGSLIYEQDAGITPTTPVSIANNDKITIEFSVPISNWTAN